MTGGALPWTGARRSRMRWTRAGLVPNSGQGRGRSLDAEEADDCRTRICPGTEASRSTAQA